MIRIHLAQIDYNPAYYDDDNIDMLRLPFVNIDDKSKSYKAFGNVNFNKLLNNLLDDVRKDYITHINDKIFAVLEKSKERNAHIVVFPEYSIPHELLTKLYTFSKDNNIIIIAGTHYIVHSGRSTYTELALMNNKDVDTYIGMAMCPVITPDKVWVKSHSSHQKC